MQPGSLFCCSPGEHVDGHDFAAAALEVGAVALLVDHQLTSLTTVPQVLVASTRNAMGHLASTLYGHPTRSMTSIGVTGTNGKTTTTHILKCALEALGHPTGVIGTLYGAHTTPEAPELQRRLAAIRDEGKQAVAMEVSSHALALDRVAGAHFDVGVFTNLGRDHLDLHGTVERYFAAKARLFDSDLCAHGVVNVDDVHGRLLVDLAPIEMTPFSLSDIDEVEIGPLAHSYRWRGTAITVGLGGSFNVANSLAAATVLDVLGYTGEQIAIALAATTPVPGRFQPVSVGQDFSVLVDYAHTPDALAQVAASARQVAAGNRVIIVFGCGGDRDRAKRPEMAHVASSMADLVVITSDNPRSEDPQAIINDTVRGVPDDYRDRVAVEIDRRQAIAQAFRAARAGDVVVIAGKGHETTQTIQSTVLAFDDREVARDLLESML